MSVLESHDLHIKVGGQEVNPASIDWGRIDIRSLNIYQPPGPDNVLGHVKFVFPNKHDVYMHDTTKSSCSGNAFGPRAMVACAFKIPMSWRRCYSNMIRDGRKGVSPRPLPPATIYT